MKAIDILRLTATAYGFKHLLGDDHVYSTISNYLQSAEAPKHEASDALRTALQMVEDEAGEEALSPAEAQWAMDITSVDRPPTLEEVRRVLNYYRL